MAISDPTTDEGIADDQSTFAGAWHADQSRLDDHVDAECACAELPDGVPCHDCFQNGAEFGGDY